MKTKWNKLLVLASSLLGLNLQAQTYCTTPTPTCSVEMVCNGGFESVTATPTAYAQLSYANGWTPTSQTPDLFSTSSSTASAVSIPCNGFGYQAAHSGNNYAGMLTNDWRGPSDPYGWIEGMFTSLSSGMIAGKIYDISLWISAGDLNNRENHNLLIDVGSSYTYTVSPSLLNDKTNWTLINFPYCAQGGENYIEIHSSLNYTLTSLTPQITAGCTYTASAGNTYLYIDDVSVKEAKFNTTSAIGCVNSPVNLSIASVCGINTNNYTYIWNYGDGSTTVNTGTNTTSSHTYSNTGTYTGSVSINAGSCSVTYTYSVNIPVLSLGITSNSTTICNGTTNFTATPSPTGSYTYAWSVKDAATGTVIPTSNYTITSGTTATPSINFANINQNVNVCATITNSMGCIATQCLYLSSCCQTPTNTLKYTNTTFTTNTTLTGTSTQKYQFGGAITINSGVTLNINTAEVTMDPNTKFSILGTGALKINSSYLHGCNAMWNGIYPLGTSTFSLTNSRVEDAQRVVVDSTGGAIIILTGNYLNKNYTPVHLKAAKTSTASFTAKNNLFTCSNIAAPTWPTYVPLTPDKTNAATFGGYSSVNLMVPFNTTKTQTGIQLNVASQTGAANTAITIGGNINEENVFDKTGEGIVSIASYMLVQSNVFQNIKSSIVPISGIPNAGVWILNINFLTTNYNSQVGGTTSQRNTFINNDNGVYDNGRQTLLVSNNTFSTQTTGITVTNNNNGHTVNTNNNNFYDNLTGIYYYNNTKITANANDNNFTNSSVIGDNWTNKAIVCNEVTLATNPLSYPNYNVYNNNITGFYRGIETTNTLNAYIYDNEVHMRQDNTSDHWQYGIEFNNTNNCRINNNTIDMNGSSRNPWAYWQNAIAGNNNQVPKVQCNSTNKVAIVMQLSGNNITAAGNGIIGNYMQDASYGVWLNNNGEIGHQYTTNTSTSADNSWATTVDLYTYTQGNSNISLSAKFYTRSSAPFDLPAIKADRNSAGSNYLFGTNNSSAGAGVCNNNTPTPSNLKTGPLLNLMQNAEAVATDNAFDVANPQPLAGSTMMENGQEDNTPNQKAIAYRNLLCNLNLQQIDVSNSPDLGTFKQNVKNQNTGLLLVVDSLLHDAEVDSTKLNVALQANNSIVPTNVVEQSQQEFNALYVSYLTQRKQLDATQITSLESIAQQCPMVNGGAVLQARALLFDLLRKNYMSSCEKTAPANMSSVARKGLSTNVEQSGISVYPNPASSQLFVEVKAYTNTKLKLFNMMGSLMIEQNIDNNQAIDISKLSSGLYTYKIYQNENELKLGKVVITH